jgi:FMN phosphatase YigB (HAD superfamily)
MRPADRSRILGVAFDVDGTLYHQWPLRVMLVGMMAVAYAVRPRHLRRVVAVVRAYRRAQEILRRPPATRGAPTPGGLDRAQRTAAARLSGEPIDVVTTIVREWFQRRPLPLLPLVRRRGLRRTLRRLQQAGCRLAVYSDYPARTKLESLGIDAFFPVVMTAGDPQIDALKPSPRGFLATAAAMGLPPGRVLYVGDRGSVDGVGAACAGMKVVIIDAGLRFGTRCRFPVIRRFHDLPLVLPRL